MKTRFRFRALRWLAARLPRRPIDGPDGDVYLERYYLAGPMAQSTAALWPSGDRPVERLGWLRKTWYLHRFLAPDPDRDLHNHPWAGRGLDAHIAFRGRVLAGAYVEYWQDIRYGRAVIQTVCPEGTTTFATRSIYHRIARLLKSFPTDPDNEVWTLVRTGQRVGSWGFLVNGVHVDHLDYGATPIARKHEITGPQS